jgi:hypothetical protein
MNFQLTGVVLSERGADQAILPGGEDSQLAIDHLGGWKELRAFLAVRHWQSSIWNICSILRISDACY